MLFLTSRAKTSISEEGIDLCRTPGAIHSAKMTYPLYGDGTYSVIVGGKFQDMGVSLNFPVDSQCCWNLSPLGNVWFLTLLFFKQSDVLREESYHQATD